MDTELNAKSYKIYVNGVERTVTQETLTYEDVVRLFIAQPVAGTIYAVSFDHAKEPKEGELVAGQSVVIKQNTEFDVDDTGRS
ncbi:multiubiquitin domain-containing protein [Ferrimicrobium sp.]|uniref:multiubiquitin domain-containing protein n=1 Tax=Ferrimicrobium sp. TaxID=2926050 RepID=UPI00262578C1|nr:multiubiquitin domain-containing protein [Ferrimicrobium sp.]